MYAFIVTMVFLASVFLNTAVEPSTVEEYRYLEKTGETYTNIEWRLEKGDHYKLTVVRPQETYMCLCNLSFETFQWEAKKPAARTEVVATREKDAIAIAGTFEGEAIKKEIRIDGAPWFQAMTLSLRPLVASDRSSTEFWTIRSDNLSVHRMKATKKDHERIRLCGSEMEVKKVKVSLTGVKALLWDCSYWFAKQGGVFVRYEGRNGPPGYPKTVIELAAGENVL